MGWWTVRVGEVVGISLTEENKERPMTLRAVGGGGGGGQDEDEDETEWCGFVLHIAPRCVRARGLTRSVRAENNG